MSAMVQTQAKLAAVLNAAGQQDQQQYLTFMLGGETYAMGIHRGRGVVTFAAS